MSAVLPWLYVGDKQVAKDRALLKRLHVRYVVNATPPRTEGGVPNYFEKEVAFEYLRVPLRDLNSEALPPVLPAFVQYFERVS